MSSTAAPDRAASRLSPALIAARVVLGLFGVLKLAGTVYFVFFASAEEGGDPSGLVDWLVAGWSAVLAVSFLVASVRLGAGASRVVRVTMGLLLVDIVFSVVKFFAYDEPEAIAFIAVDLLLLALLTLVRRSSRFARVGPASG